MKKTNQIKRQTAAQAYGELNREAVQIIAEIETAIRDRAKGGELDWSHVGSLGAALENLKSAAANSGIKKYQEQ